MNLEQAIEQTVDTPNFHIFFGSKTDKDYNCILFQSWEKLPTGKYKSLYGDREISTKEMIGEARRVLNENFTNWANGTTL